MAAATVGKDVEILLACRRALGRHGYRRLTMDDIAEEARMGKRTLYMYFSSKEELVRATIERVVDGTREAMAKALAEGADPLEKLRRMLSERILLRLQDFGPFHRSLEDLNQALYPFEKRHEYFREEVDLVRRALQEGIRAGLFFSADPVRTSEVLIRSTNSYLPSQLNPEMAASPQLVRTQLGELIELLIKGLQGDRK